MYKTIIISAIIGGIAGSLITQYTIASQEPTETTQKELIQEFYNVENAVHISPHGLRKHMADRDDYVLVDLRSPEEYENEHIVTAINIPAYKDPEHSAYDEVDRIVNSFKKIPEDKEIIVYCYSTPCMTGRKIGKMLAEHNIYVKLLGIGWNEWRYYWDLWNHDGEAPSNVQDYIVSGSDPGQAPETGNLPLPCGEDDFGC